MTFHAKQSAQERFASINKSMDAVADSFARIKRLLWVYRLLLIVSTALNVLLAAKLWGL